MRQSYTLTLALTIALTSEHVRAARIKSSADAATDFTQAACQTTNAFYVTQLPDFSGPGDWPCSYAGTLNGNPNAGQEGQNNHELFFWMYPAIDADAPVTVWLNGGPGASSTFANFLFSSPLRISQDSTTGAFDMYTSEETWIKASTVIYID